PKFKYNNANNGMKNVPVAAPADLTSWWPGDGDGLDIIGGLNGVLQGGATWSAGEVGRAFDLNGYDGYVEAPDSSTWAFGSSDFTIELWANFRSINRNYSIWYPDVVFVGNDEGPYDVNKWFFALSDGKLNFLIDDPDLGPSFLVQAPFEPNMNQWYHLAIVRSGSTF